MQSQLQQFSPVALSMITSLLAVYAWPANNGQGVFTADNTVAFAIVAYQVSCAWVCRAAVEVCAAQVATGFLFMAEAY